MNPLWLAGRATGLVTLILLTSTLVLGLLDASGSAAGPRRPGFVVGALHRNVSLLAVMLLAVHVTSAVIDPYAGIGWLETVVPFTSHYRPFALGLGAVALDLVLAVVVSSLLRHRLGRRGWRAIHVAGYACWPLTVAHGLLVGGPDTGTGWVLAVQAVCVLAVGGACLVRSVRRGASPSHRVRVP